MANYEEMSGDELLEEVYRLRDELAAKRQTGGEIQWRVVWFPPDKDNVTWTTSNEGMAVVKAEAPGVAEWNPLIESRIIGEWVLRRG